MIPTQSYVKTLITEILTTEVDVKWSWGLPRAVLWAGFDLGHVFLPFFSLSMKIKPLCKEVTQAH